MGVEIAVAKVPSQWRDGSPAHLDVLSPRGRTVLSAKRERLLAPTVVDVAGRRVELGDVAGPSSLRLAVSGTWARPGGGAGRRPKSKRSREVVAQIHFKHGD